MREWIAALTSALIVAGAANAGPTACEPNPVPALGEHPWLVPFGPETVSDPTAQQEAFYEFMWQTFIALNWSAAEITGGENENIRGQPDCTASLVDNDPQKDHVWETRARSLLSRVGMMRPAGLLELNAPDGGLPVRVAFRCGHSRVSTRQRA